MPWARDSLLPNCLSLMSRSLRPRKSRPSYAAAIDLGSDEERIVPQDDDASSDDYKPVTQGDEEPEAAESDEVDELDDEDEEVLVKPARKPSKSEAKTILSISEAKLLPQKAAKRTSIANRDGPSFSRPSNRQHYALPMPSQDHRYRSKPLYCTNARVERLSTPPRLFEDAVTTSTNNWAMNESIADRYNKASGYNVGPGPIWDFMEDRSWWKESLRVADGETETEASRRPKVYENDKVLGNLEILDETYVRMYYFLIRAYHTF